MGTINLTEEQLEQALLIYFSEPDVSDCFTIALVANVTGWGRTKVETWINHGVERGEIELAATIGQSRYFRFTDPARVLDNVG